MARRFSDEALTNISISHMLSMTFWALITVIGFAFAPVGIIISVIGIVGFTIYTVKFFLYYVRLLANPLYNLYFFLTGHSEHSVNSGYGNEYADRFQFILHGIFGRALFWVILFVFLGIIFFYRPVLSEDGNSVSAYTVGKISYAENDVIVYKEDGKRLTGSIIGTDTTDGTHFDHYLVKTTSGKTIELSPIKILGIYKEYPISDHYSFFTEAKGFTESVIGGVQKFYGTGVWVIKNIGK